METLGPRVYAFVILIGITKTLSVGLVPTYTPTGDVQECPFPGSIKNKACYNERF